MRLNNKKHAFSLTELLIVMVVIAVLFAALVPIVTSRRNGASVSTENIWNYVNDDDYQKDIYYDSGVPKWTSTAYIGLKPSILSSYSPRAKVVISASSKLKYKNTPQRQIQFRYGSGDGVNAGSLYMDRRSISLGSNNDSVISYFRDYNNIDYSYSSPENTIAGLGAFSNVTKYPIRNVAFGSNSIKYLISPKYNTVVGFGAFGGDKPYENSNNNVYIGASVANFDRHVGYSNIAVGASSMYSGLNKDKSSIFDNRDNTYLGYLVGAANPDTTELNGNVIVGSQYYAGAKDSKSNYNTIIGYDTLIGGPRNMVNNTAVGFQACNSIQKEAKSGSRTCIGYQSGASRGISGGETPSTIETDGYDHVFLGGIPKGGFNGRAVVEVYNQKAKSLIEGWSGSTRATSPTVALNSNLVVRGALFTTNDYAALSAFSHDQVERKWLNSRRSADHCRRWGGLVGRKKWRWFFEVQDADSKSASSLHSDTLHSNHLCVDERSSYRKDAYEFGSACPNIKTSDKRLKDIISENNDGLAHIEVLMPYNFTFKNDKDKKAQVGVIAQDLQKVYPSAVIKGKDGYLRIRWDEMFYSMINAIKTLDKKLVAIASSISEMESDLIQIKSEQKNIKKQIAVLNSRAAKLERK